MASSQWELQIAQTYNWTDAATLMCWCLPDNVSTWFSMFKPSSRQDSVSFMAEVSYEHVHNRKWIKHFTLNVYSSALHEKQILPQKTIFSASQEVFRQSEFWQISVSQQFITFTVVAWFKNVWRSRALEPSPQKRVTLNNPKSFTALWWQYSVFGKLSPTLFPVKARTSESLCVRCPLWDCHIR